MHGLSINPFLDRRDHQWVIVPRPRIDHQHVHYPFAVSVGHSREKNANLSTARLHFSRFEPEEWSGTEGMHTVLG